MKNILFKASVMVLFTVLVMHLKTGKNGEQDESLYFSL